VAIGCAFFIRVDEYVGPARDQDADEIHLLTMGDYRLSGAVFLLEGIADEPAQRRLVKVLQHLVRFQHLLDIHGPTSLLKKVYLSAS
jgi:hypothetical protein